MVPLDRVDRLGRVPLGDSPCPLPFFRGGGGLLIFFNIQTIFYYYTKHLHTVSAFKPHKSRVHMKKLWFGQETYLEHS